MEDNEDQIWLDALAGKSVETSNKKIVLDAKFLRGAIKEHIAEEKFHADGLDRLLINLNRVGLLSKDEKKGYGQQIFRLVKKLRLLIIFILGLIAGVLMPMQMATRGGSNSPVIENFFQSKTKINISNHLVIVDPNPFTKAQEIIFSAVAAGLTVTINLEGQNINLLIKGFKKMDPNFVATNSILGISNQTEGNVSVLIKAHQ